MENPMRQAIIRTCAALLVVGGVSSLAGAQGNRPPGGMVTTPVARRAADVWNASGTTRTNGAFDLASGRTVDGSVAVLNGPVTIAGTVRGSLVAINADVRLAPGARVERDLIVIGGSVTGADSASLGGETLQQAELLRYRLTGDQLQIDREP